MEICQVFIDRENITENTKDQSNNKMVNVRPQEFSCQ